MYPDIPTLTFAPPPSAIVRTIDGLAPLADLIDQWHRAKQAVQAASDAYRACLPTDGDAWLSAGTDAKKAAAVLGRIPQRYAEWSAAAAAADSIAIEAALFPDDGSANRDNVVALAELDQFLAGLPRSWDTADDPAAAIERAEARLKSERLRRNLWNAKQVAEWFRLPSRIGFASGVGNIGGVAPQAPNAWPLGSLSPAALAGLNALMGTDWSLTKVAGLMTAGSAV